MSGRSSRAWKTTPREITPEMRGVAWGLLRGNLRPDEIWKYMWDAAPTNPTENVVLRDLLRDVLTLADDRIPIDSFNWQYLSEEIRQVIDPLSTHYASAPPASEGERE